MSRTPAGFQVSLDCFEVGVRDLMQGYQPHPGFMTTCKRIRRHPFAKANPLAEDLARFLASEMPTLPAGDTSVHVEGSISQGVARAYALADKRARERSYIERPPKDAQHATAELSS